MGCRIHSILSALGWIIYRRAYLAGTIVPSDKDAYNDLKSKRSLPPYYPRFAPLILSLENSLPLVKLGQADKWQPDPEASSQLIPSPKREPAPPSSLIGSPIEGASGSKKVSESDVSDQVGEKNAIDHPLSAVSALDKKLAEPLPPMFAAVRRGVRSMLYATGLRPDTSGQSATTPLSRRYTSPTFLKWVIWIQILFGWLFATLFVAGITGIVRKQ
jgi:hypothetical protein